MRKKAGLAAVVLLAVGLSACSSPASPAASSADPNRTITIAQGSAPANLDPLQDETRSVQSVFGTMFETLTTVDASGALQPLLATSWTQTDPTTWRFTLRSGVTFQDGEAFDAAAVKYTIERMQDPNEKSTKLVRLGNVTTATVVDATTIDIATKTPMPLLPSELSQLWMVPPTYTAANPDTAAANPIGTGPYKISSYTPAQEVTVTASDTYWGDKPATKTIVWKAIPDEAARISALQSGQVDLINGYSPDQIPTLEAGGSTVQGGSTGLGMVLTMNTLTGPMADVNVRKAAQLALDVPNIVDNLLSGYGTVLDDQVLSTDTFGYNAALKPVSQNITEAKALLAAAGYAGGVPVTFSAPNGRYTNDTQVAQAIAEQLKEAGFDVTLKAEDYQPFLATVKTKTPDLYMIGWYSTPLFDASTALQWFKTDGVYSYWSNPDFDAALATAASTADPDARTTAFATATQIMADEVPAAPLYEAQTLYAFDSKLSGWTPRKDDIISYTSLDPAN